MKMSTGEVYCGIAAFLLEAVRTQTPMVVL